MRTAPFKLLAILAVASLSAAGCGDDGGTSGGDGTTAGDGDAIGGDGDGTPSETDGTTPSETDGTTPSETDGTTPTDGDTTQTCGLRECGTFGELDCGDCADKPGTVCNDNGRCVVPGSPLGAFCGITPTCTTASDDFPACLDAQCDSNLCLANTAGGVYTFASFRDWVNVFPASFCTASCNMYKDSNNDGVNDADAQDDCNPADIVDGPVGNAMRCVNFNEAGANPVGLCMPGTDFKVCDEPGDCTNEGEGCELTSANGLLEGRCLTNYKAGEWGDVVGIGGECNADPEAGEVAFCEAGYCEFFGCSPNCGEDADCMTVAAGTCSGGTCTGRPSKTCASDAECSSFECGSLQLTETESFGRCGPKGCGIEDDCGPGFSCEWGWNGSVGTPAPDNSCVGQIADGEDLGAPCDPDPTDNEIVNGGAECKTGLCLGEACSQVCDDDGQCGDGICGFYEFTEAFVSCDIDEDCGAGNACTAEDGACYDTATFQYVRGPDEDGDGQPDNTFALGLNFCTSLEGATGSCLAKADCAADELCNVYAKQNYAGDVVDADAPIVLAGVCQPATGDGDLGDECTGFADCKSGFCLPLTDTFAFCSEPCTASSQCGSFNIGEDPANGYCDSFLYAFGGDLDAFTHFTYIGLCVPEFGSTADCSDDFTCDALTEACFPNTVAGADPTKPAVSEALCYQVWEVEGDRGQKALGEACDPAAEVAECESGLCSTEVLDETKGYCSALCNEGDTCGGGDLACTGLVRFPRSGAYAENSGGFNLCLKDQDCAACGSQLDCPGSLVCANLGTNANPAFHCVEGCTEVADCADAEVTTACNDTVDQFGVPAKGCFAKTGAVPQNYCQP